MMSNVCAQFVSGAEAKGLDSGAYQLIIRLDRGRNIRVGALGALAYPAGRYIYTGRASKNLISRLERHLRSEKTLRWHVDYLLQWAGVAEIRIFPRRPDAECAINLRTARSPGCSFPVQGFGSSDCLCPSHLIWAGKDNEERP